MDFVAEGFRVGQWHILPIPGIKSDPANKGARVRVLSVTQDTLTLSPVAVSEPDNPDWHAVALRLARALRANIDRLVEVDAHDFTCLTTYDESQGPCDCGMPAHIESMRNALAAEGM